MLRYLFSLIEITRMFCLHFLTERRQEIPSTKQPSRTADRSRTRRPTVILSKSCQGHAGTFYSEVIIGNWSLIDLRRWLALLSIGKRMRRRMGYKEYGRICCLVVARCNTLYMGDFSLKSVSRQTVVGLPYLLLCRVTISVAIVDLPYLLLCRLTIFIAM